MIIPLNWIKEYAPIDLPVDELATLIGARLVEIESVDDITKKYDSVYIVKVVECEPLEGSDHLNVTKIDDGGKVKDIDRDKNGLIQVVCGAPNVHADMLTVWLPPSSIVPESFHDLEPFVLSAKPLRGVLSNGMLASAKELDLFEDHTGIVDLGDELKPGDLFAEVFNFKDYLFEIENKSLTHRPDTFGIIGFAREIAAIQGKHFFSPEWYTSSQIFPTPVGKISKPIISIDDPSLSERYSAVVISGISSTQHSPFQIQTLLSRVGLRPISAAVDVTNYLMMLTGQPLHAFDYDKVVALAGEKYEIHVREAKENETLELLDGRTITLTPQDIVVAANDIVIGLAGAMGGASTAVDDTTTSVIIEAATFNLYRLRSTQMRHGIYSEAITRFTKGQPAMLSEAVLRQAITLLNEWTGAVQASEVADVIPEPLEQQKIEVTVDYINSILGSNFTRKDILQTLWNVEMATNYDEQSTDPKAIIEVVVPHWRKDLKLPEDIVEEVGRINGFDTIVSTLPIRDFMAVLPSSFDQTRSKIRKTLARAGANEILTYSFVHGDIIRRAGQDPLNSYRITNSISPELQYYRQTLTPSILNMVFHNIKQGNESFALFELNKVHQKSNGLTIEDVPQEVDSIAFVTTSRKPGIGAPYYVAKRSLDFLAMTFGFNLSYVALDEIEGHDAAVIAPFEPKRSAIVTDRISGTVLGVIGEYKKSVLREFKLPEYSAGFELDTQAFNDAAQKIGYVYEAISKFPSIERDICFQVDQSVSYMQLIDTTAELLQGVSLSSQISPIDLYQPEDVSKKNITIRIRLTSNDRTLRGEEVNELMAALVKEMQTLLGATVI